MSFKDIVGQSPALEILSAQLASRRIAHAYLFLGPEGVGRKKTAMEFARALNCELPTAGHSCDHCRSCVKVSHDHHPDVRLVGFAYQAALEGKEVEKQKSIKIDTIRALQRDVNLKPSEGSWKVYIIDPAEKITADAAHCLLKTLEEPPAWTVIILLAQHRENLPATVVSRTQIIRFRPLPEDTIAGYLLRTSDLDDRAARELARLSGGSFSAAENLRSQDLEAASRVWGRLNTPGLSTAELLMLSQEHSRQAAGLVDELLAMARSELSRDPSLGQRRARIILDHRALFEKNVNPTYILDSLLVSLAGGASH